MEYTFTAIIKKVKEGYIGYIAELPGANTQGKTLVETRKNLKEAVSLILQANKEINDKKDTDRTIREEIKVVV